MKARFDDLPAASEIFPQILSFSEPENEIRLQLEISPELAWFRGHFPGQPVLPGVVQLHWAAMVASRLFGFDTPPQHIKRLKFSNVIMPPCEIELMLVRHGSNEVQFTVHSDSGQHSQGRMVFAEHDT
jgi:3-hydroxymyristoyl/3-hydroxydecanoyl-(acyl carrier protein) dehydratase